jgi:hypothetical protein
VPDESCLDGLEPLVAPGSRDTPGVEDLVADHEAGDPRPDLDHHACRVEAEHTEAVRRRGRPQLHIHRVDRDRLHPHDEVAGRSLRHRSGPRLQRRGIGGGKVRGVSDLDVRRLSHALRLALPAGPIGAEGGRGRESGGK